MYLITAITTYPPENTDIESYTEAYYVKDVSSGSDTPDGVWSFDDPIVDNTGATNQRFRVTQEMLFDDGSVRYETSENGTLVDQLEDLFTGSEHSILAESVFRKEVVFDAPGGALAPEAVAMNSIMRTHVVDITNQIDVQVQILNEDTLRLMEWDGDTFHIPSGD